MITVKRKIKLKRDAHRRRDVGNRLMIDMAIAAVQRKEGG